MKRTIVTTLFLFLSIFIIGCKKNAASDDVEGLVDVLDCSSVKTGKFKYANPAYGEWIIDGMKLPASR